MAALEEVGGATLQRSACKSLMGGGSAGLFDSRLRQRPGFCAKYARAAQGYHVEDAGPPRQGALGYPAGSEHLRWDLRARSEQCLNSDAKCRVNEASLAMMAAMRAVGVYPYEMIHTGTWARTAQRTAISEQQKGVPNGLWSAIWPRALLLAALWLSTAEESHSKVYRRGVEQMVPRNRNPR